jgi:hypothetical protein
MKNIAIIIALLFFNLSNASAQQQIGYAVESGTRYDFMGKVKTNSNAVQKIYTYKAENGEAGIIEIRYTCTDASTNNKTLDRLVRFRKTSAGVLTVSTPQTVFSDNEPALNSCDFTVISSGGFLVIRVTGLNGTEVSHTIKANVTSNIFNSNQ